MIASTGSVGEVLAHVVRHRDMQPHRVPHDRQINNLTIDVVTQPARLSTSRTGLRRVQDLAEHVSTVLAVKGGIGNRHPKLDRAANRVGNSTTLRHGSCRCRMSV